MKKSRFREHSTLRYSGGMTGTGIYLPGNVIKFADTFLIKANIKNAAYIQIKVESSEAHRGIGIAGMRIEYMESKPLRRMK